ncbi:DNA helicase RecQ [Halobacteriovorax sp. HLS]|uniref:DNA helicase RecQ n=1 Tax=Halobacteriovorax sp. HLS TaxID=2234000 RepID=UPI000FDA07DB|nr:DNA helicase RecQ [Halobacteriovorax sp. HLS]
MQRALEILNKVFGYDDFRFNQRSAVESILSKRDTFVLMPTGGGKSLCYQIPMLSMDGVGVVISPLISLMINQVNALKINGVSANYLNSTLSSEEYNDVLLSCRSGETKILYLSPEGLKSPRVIEFLKNIELSIIAIDEAHCVSQWGHEFRPDYRELSSLKVNFPETPLIALTATADEKVRKDIVNQLGLENPLELVSSFDRPNIKYQIRPREKGIDQLVKFIKESHEDECGIIYCQTRNKVETTANKLKALGFNAYAYHAGLDPEERHRVQALFESSDNIIIVATIAFGMGIDKPDIRFVCHMGLPKNIESYYQETGRAGRDGSSANAWMIYGLDDLIRNKQFLENSDASGVYKELANSKIESMLSFCELTTCRRRFLLNYFDENVSADCGNCDCCHDEVHKEDATLEARKALSTVFRTGQRFGVNHLIEVLQGKVTSKILNNSHEELGVFGLGKDRSEKYWRRLYRNLIFRKYLTYASLEYKTLKLDQKSSEVLKGNEEFYVLKVEDSRPLRKKPAESLNLNDQDQILFEELRNLRKDLALKLDIPAYLIFPDKTLIELSSVKPMNEVEMLEINGVGVKKFERFGADFLEKISYFK